MLLVAAAVLLGAVVQSATGFGFALVVGPAVFAVMAPARSLTTLVVLGLVLSTLLLTTERRRLAVHRHHLLVLVAAAVPGEVVGALALAVVPAAALQVAVGVLVLAAVVVQLRGPGRAAAPPSRRRATVGSAAVGLVTGAVSTSTGVSGPPVLLWLQRVGLAPAALRDTLAAVFLGLALSTLVVLAASGQLQAPPGGLGVLAGLAVLVAVGQRLGRAVFARLSPAAFRVATLVVVTGAGVASLRAGLAG